MYADPEKRRQHDRKKYAENPKHFNETWKRSYEKNKEKWLAHQKKYREENKEKRRLAFKLWYEKNKDKVAERKKRNRPIARIQERVRTATDINFKLKKNLRRRIHHALKGTVKKSKHTMELVGCSIPELKTHLESYFTEGMSWDNYGTWHVDHDKPCAKFNLSDPEEQKKCFHYTNLRPLWASENISKGCKYETKIS